MPKKNASNSNQNDENLSSIMVADYAANPDAYIEQTNIERDMSIKKSLFHFIHSDDGVGKRDFTLDDARKMLTEKNIDKTIQSILEIHDERYLDHYFDTDILEAEGSIKVIEERIRDVIVLGNDLEEQTQNLHRAYQIGMVGEMFSPAMQTAYDRILSEQKRSSKNEPEEASKEVPEGVLKKKLILLENNLAQRIVEESQNISYQILTQFNPKTSDILHNAVEKLVRDGGEHEKQNFKEIKNFIVEQQDLKEEKTANIQKDITQKLYDDGKLQEIFGVKKLNENKKEVFQNIFEKLKITNEKDASEICDIIKNKINGKQVESKTEFLDALSDNISNSTTKESFKSVIDEIEINEKIDKTRKSTLIDSKATVEERKSTLNDKKSSIIEEVVKSPQQQKENRANLQDKKIFYRYVKKNIESQLDQGSLTQEDREKFQKQLSKECLTLEDFSEHADKILSKLKTGNEDLFSGVQEHVFDYGLSERQIADMMSSSQPKLNNLRDEIIASDDKKDSLYNAYKVGLISNIFSEHMHFIQSRFQDNPEIMPAIEKEIEREAEIIKQIAENPELGGLISEYKITDFLSKHFTDIAEKHASKIQENIVNKLYENGKLQKIFGNKSNETLHQNKKKLFQNIFKQLNVMNEKDALTVCDLIKEGIEKKSIIQENDVVGVASKTEILKNLQKNLQEVMKKDPSEITSGNPNDNFRIKIESVKAFQEQFNAVKTIVERKAKALNNQDKKDDPLSVPLENKSAQSHKPAENVTVATDDLKKEALSKKPVNNPEPEAKKNIPAELTLENWNRITDIQVQNQLYRFIKESDSFDITQDNITAQITHLEKTEAIDILVDDNLSPSMNQVMREVEDDILNQVKLAEKLRTILDINNDKLSSQDKAQKVYQAYQVGFVDSKLTSLLQSRIEKEFPGEFSKRITDMVINKPQIIEKILEKLPKDCKNIQKIEKFQKYIKDGKLEKLLDKNVDAYIKAAHTPEPEKPKKQNSIVDKMRRFVNSSDLSTNTENKISQSVQSDNDKTQNKPKESIENASLSNIHEPFEPKNMEITEKADPPKEPLKEAPQVETPLEQNMQEKIAAYKEGIKNYTLLLNTYQQNESAKEASKLDISKEDMMDALEKRQEKLDGLHSQVSSSLSAQDKEEIGQIENSKEAVLTQDQYMKNFMDISKSQKSTADLQNNSTTSKQEALLNDIENFLSDNTQQENTAPLFVDNIHLTLADLDKHLGIDDRKQQENTELEAQANPVASPERVIEKLSETLKKFEDNMQEKASEGEAVTPDVLKRYQEYRKIYEKLTDQTIEIPIFERKIDENKPPIVLDTNALQGVNSDFADKSYENISSRLAKLNKNITIDSELSSIAIQLPEGKKLSYEISEDHKTLVNYLNNLGKNAQINLYERNGEVVLGIYDFDKNQHQMVSMLAPRNIYEIKSQAEISRFMNMEAAPRRETTPNPLGDVQNDERVIEKLEILTDIYRNAITDTSMRDVGAELAKDQPDISVIQGKIEQYFSNHFHEMVGGILEQVHVPDTTKFLDGEDTRNIQNILDEKDSAKKMKMIVENINDGDKQLLKGIPTNPALLQIYNKLENVGAIDQDMKEELKKLCDESVADLTKGIQNDIDRRWTSIKKENVIISPVHNVNFLQNVSNLNLSLGKQHADMIDATNIITNKLYQSHVMPSLTLYGGLLQKQVESQSNMYLDLDDGKLIMTVRQGYENNHPAHEISPENFLYPTRDSIGAENKAYVPYTYRLVIDLNNISKDKGTIEEQIMTPEFARNNITFESNSLIPATQLRRVYENIAKMEDKYQKSMAQQRAEREAKAQAKIQPKPQQENEIKNSAVEQKPVEENQQKVGSIAPAAQQMEEKQEVKESAIDKLLQQPIEKIEKKVAEPVLPVNPVVEEDIVRETKWQAAQPQPQNAGTQNLVSEQLQQQNLEIQNAEMQNIEPPCVKDIVAEKPVDVSIAAGKPVEAAEKTETYRMYKTGLTKEMQGEAFKQIGEPIIDEAGNTTITFQDPRPGREGPEFQVQYVYGPDKENGERGDWIGVKGGSQAQCELPLIPIDDEHNQKTNKKADVYFDNGELKIRSSEVLNKTLEDAELGKLSVAVVESRENQSAVVDWKNIEKIDIDKYLIEKHGVSKEEIIGTEFKLNQPPEKQFLEFNIKDQKVVAGQSSQHEQAAGAGVENQSQFQHMEPEERQNKSRMQRLLTSVRSLFSRKAVDLPGPEMNEKGKRDLNAQKRKLTGGDMIHPSSGIRSKIAKKITGVFKRDNGQGI